VAGRCHVYSIYSLTYKYNPLHAGCHIKLPWKIKLKRMVVNVQFTDNACFAWSVVAALYPAEKHFGQKSSYPDYTSVLNLKNIEFPMILNQIKKFENQNNISISVYCIEKQKKLSILPIHSNSSRRRWTNILICYMCRTMTWNISRGSKSIPPEFST